FLHLEFGFSVEGRRDGVHDVSEDLERRRVQRVERVAASIGVRVVHAGRARVSELHRQAVHDGSRLHLLVVLLVVV
ncbi:MAG: hypothetical protein MK135_16170, partial [Polyangiaceae bacterium]|nr:hypothetical protein [Polyangiaceae bacterium]